MDAYRGWCRNQLNHSPTLCRQQEHHYDLMERKRSNRVLRHRFSIVKISHFSLKLNNLMKRGIIRPHESLS